MPIFTADELEARCVEVFIGAGLSIQEARRVAHSLVLANSMGHDSHGVIRVPQYVDFIREERYFCGKEIRIVREADASAVVDGGWGFGQTICHQAMALAIEKAQQRSVGVVEVFNCGHVGRLGEYVETAAEREMIGIVMCNNHGSGLLQAPYGGIDARMSPNPIAVGIPTGEDHPIVVDMTSSVVAEGKIRVKRNLGEELPIGWVVDPEGNPTTEPDVFYGPPRGAILPFGGICAHKGYALAIVVDVLSGALGGGGCSRDGVQRGGNGLFVMAIDIGAFIDRKDFKEEIRNFIGWLKSSRVMPGFEEIVLPGHPEATKRRKTEKEGIAIDDATWKQILEAAEKVGVEI